MCPGDRIRYSATLVLAIFHMARVVLIDYDSWKERPGDREAQLALIDNLRRYRLDTVENIERIAEQAKGVRFRPEEVVAAAVTPLDVKTMEQLEPLGKRVVEMLSSRTG